MIDYQLKLDFN